MYNYQKMKQATKLFLEAIGEDLNREGIRETPDRVARMYKDIMNGYDLDPKEHLKIFKEKTKNMVLVSNIPLYSFCEHHLVLFKGIMTVAYIPNGKVIGLSKLVRIARVYAKRPQIQERLTDQIAEALDNALKPKGVAVNLKMEHFCMAIRGVKTPGALTSTTRLTGLFLNPDKNKNPKSEFLQALI